MKTLNSYIIEKFKISKNINTLLNKDDFIDYIKTELDGEVIHIDNEEVDVYLICLKDSDYNKLDDVGYPIPRFELELENDFFRFFGEEEYIKSDESTEEVNTDSFEKNKFKGEYKYSLKNAELIINILKEDNK